MSEYKYKVTDGIIETCHTCAAEAPVRTFDIHREGIGALSSEKQELCEVCASSMISNAAHYPSQYENTELFQALGYCTNMLLDAITQRRKDLPK